MQVTTEGNTAPPTGPISDYIALYIAEYAALTNRCTYWIALQVGIATALLIFIGLLPPWLSVLRQDAIVWGGCVIGQLIMLSWNYTFQEQFRTVCYIECELRPRVQAMLELQAPGGAPNQRVQYGDCVWGYETFLAKRRGPMTLWSEAVFFILTTIMLIVVAALRLSSFSRFDSMGLLANLILLGLLFQGTNERIALRRQFAKCATAKSHANLKNAIL